VGSLGVSKYGAQALPILLVLLVLPIAETVIMVDPQQHEAEHADHGVGSPQHHQRAHLVLVAKSDGSSGAKG
jgi:hypothetical protein